MKRLPQVQEAATTQRLPDTVPALFQQTAARRAGAPGLNVRVGDKWVSFSWEDYAQAVARFSNALLKEGVESGDRVAVWSANRPEWQIADLGTVHVGAATVAVYQTSAPSQVEYLLKHSESKVVVVETPAMLEQVTTMRDRLPALRRVVLIEGDAHTTDGWVITWKEALALGDQFARVCPSVFASRWQAVRPSDMASIIYTSGTTGTPKGAILTHRNLTWTVEDTLIDVPGSPDDRLLSYLSLAHVLERVVSHLRQLCTGCEIFFCPSVSQVRTMLSDVRPTYFTSVPYIWEKTYALVKKELDGVSGGRQLILDWALRLGAARTAIYEDCRRPSAWSRLQWAIADRVVFHRTREMLGLDRARITVSGSAALSPAILRFFYGIGVEILEGYGLTESTAPATANLPGQARFGTVGRPMPGVEVKIAPDGEILIRAPSVFEGYFKDPRSTAEALTDGWLRTGDIGRLDPDGYLTFTDRKKDLCKTSGGKYVAPGAIENILKSHRGISQAVVLCDGRPYVAALITLDRDAAEACGGPEDPAALRLVEEAITDVNRNLSHPEQIKRWKILPGDFTVNDELTPTLKVKRTVIAEKYADIIDTLYAEKRT